MKKILWGLLGLVGASSAWADGSVFFVGIDSSYVKYNDSDFSRRFSDADSAGVGTHLFGGVWVNDHFGLELGYADLSYQTTMNDWFFDVSEYDAEYSVDIAYLQVLAAIRPTNRSKLFAKVGPYYSFVDLEVNTNNWFSPDRQIYKEDDNNLGVFFGAGMEFEVSQHFSLRAQVERVNQVGTEEVGKANLTLGSFGVAYNF